MLLDFSEKSEQKGINNITPIEKSYSDTKYGTFA